MSEFLPAHAPVGEMKKFRPSILGFFYASQPRELEWAQMAFLMVPNGSKRVPTIKKRAWFGAWGSKPRRMLEGSFAETGQDLILGCLQSPET